MRASERLECESKYILGRSDLLYRGRPNVVRGHR